MRFTATSRIAQNLADLDGGGRGKIANPSGGIWALAWCRMKRRCAFGTMVLAFSVYSGASALSLALEYPAVDSRVGSSAVSNWTDSAAPIVQVTPSPAAAGRAMSGNPLWGIPFAQFPATRDRPIFSPSRRPPALPVAPAVVPRVVAAPKPKEPERPQLALVGTIVSLEAGFGIFLDQASKSVIRLKIGEDFQGWKLRTVQSRETALEKDEQLVTLVLPEPGLAQVSTEVAPPQPPPPPATQAPPPQAARQATRPMWPESSGPNRAGRRATP